MTAGAILTGGKSRRLGWDKRGALVAGETLLSRAIARMRPQVTDLVLVGGGGAEGLLLLEDPIPDAGPLSGVLAAMDWARSRGVGQVVSAAVDCPFLPVDLVKRLAAPAAATPSALVVAAAAGRRHPVFACWPATLAGHLRNFLDSGERAVVRFQELNGAIEVDFPASSVDPFFNVNTPEDLAEAQRLADRNS